MQFINIVVHSVENMNFRVYLQYEFTQHGLDDYLEASLTFDQNLTENVFLSNDIFLTLLCWCVETEVHRE